MAQPKFFITHSWHDIEFAKRLYDDLIANGLEGFLDAHSVNPGDSIPSRIERGLKECDVYIPIFSPDALNSDWCDWEIDMAITMNRTRKGRPRIIPVIAEPCEVPDRLMHILHINFVGRYDNGLNELLTKGFVVSPKTITSSLPIEADDWEEEKPVDTGLILFAIKRKRLIIGALVALVATIALIIIGASSIFKPTPAEPTSAAVVLPNVTQQLPLNELLVNTPTVTRTNTPTATPTLVPSPTFTAAPRVTPTSAAIATPTLGIGSKRISQIDNADMFYVPAGEFSMGSKNPANFLSSHPSASNIQLHNVYTDAYWMDKFKVTNERFKKCVDAGECREPNPFLLSNRPYYYGSERFNTYPVYGIRWYDANAYCNWAGKRLPTEAAWEKAARGADGRLYPWGNTPNTNLLNSEAWNTDPVGSHPDRASPYGVMDLVDFLGEWVADWFDAQFYVISPTNNPQGPSSGRYKVVRGGRWQGYDAVNREGYEPDYQQNSGFRCVQ